MIITGCLAVVSGVIESYCHYKPASSNVPKWLCKLARKRQGQKHKDTASGMVESDYSRVANANISDVPEKRMQICVTEDSSTESLSVNMETEITWKELASAINKLMLLACIFITVASIITILFTGVFVVYQHHPVLRYS